MSAKRSRKISKLVMALLPIAFLSIIGIVALAIVSVISVAKSELPAENDGIPASWTNYESVSGIDSRITARVIDDTHVQYLASLKNNSATEKFAISHLSSYINGNEKSGFVFLDAKSLEYTYEPNRENSWTPVPISEPGIANDNFKLDYGLHISQSGTKTDAIYFRFNVNLAKDGVVDNIMSYVIKDSSADTEKLISSSVSIDTDEQKSLTKDSEEVTSWATISSITFDKDSKNSLSSNVIVIAAAIGIFALGVAIYLVCRI